jgi:DNA-binding CsgD family transcriptional regulator/tetratricopeptide (TPR) repeat protein
VAALEALLDSAREERSAVLVLRGEPGIGKTALLEAIESSADGMRVLRCVGIEAEHELAFAGMHQLVRPCLDLIDRLPAPQAAALRSALGLSADAVEDRFLVSLGLLSLLAEYGEQGPVLCLVDDAQWLDRPSAEALAFAARRLEAEPIAVVIAAREGDSQRFEAPGLPELRLAGIPDSDAAELVRGRLGRDLPPETLSVIVGAAGGNPLALLEMPAGLTPAQLEGSAPIVGPPGARGAVEAEYRSRVGALPEPAQRALLVAAADELGDAAVVGRAAEALGGSLEDLGPAAEAGLVTVDDRVEFRHPLIRSAVYRSASRDERRRAHEALADVIEDPSRSVWHRAAITDGADEELAAELETAGQQAVARGAQVTAAAAFERAADLSDDPARRAARLSHAAGTSVEAGRMDAALALVERARPLSSDPRQLAPLEMVRSVEAMRRGSPLESHSLTMAAGTGLAAHNPDQARTMILWSLFAATQGGWAERVVGDVHAALGAIDGGGDPELQGYGLALLDGLEAVVDGRIEAAVEHFDEVDRHADALKSVPVATMPVYVLLVRGEFAEQCEVIARQLAEARAHGAAIGLAGALSILGGAQVFDRRLRPAVASVDEGLQYARQFGYLNDETGLLALRARIAALQGREDAAREDAAEAMRRSLANGIGWATINARLALAELELGLGNAAEALAQLDQLDRGLIPPIWMMAVPDLVDAAMRVGEPDRAVEAVEAYADWAPVSRATRVHATLGRVRAQVANDGDPERLFKEALDLHRLEASPFERARTELAYGEWLRRERRKTDARAQLRNALDTFAGMGTALWAERARGELEATGETARKRDPSTVDDLTPQELRIARLVAGGATNRDVAAQLFVSPKTVEYHLRKVFMKLGVKSRVELAGARLDPLAEPN